MTLHGNEGWIDACRLVTLSNGIHFKLFAIEPLTGIYVTVVIALLAALVLVIRS